MNEPTTSEWLREALRTALQRDPVEAANDAEILRTVLLRRAAEAVDPDVDATGTTATTSRTLPLPGRASAD